MDLVRVPGRSFRSRARAPTSSAARWRPRRARCGPHGTRGPASWSATTRTRSTRATDSSAPLTRLRRRSRRLIGADAATHRDHRQHLPGGEHRDPDPRRAARRERRRRRRHATRRAPTPGTPAATARCAFVATDGVADAAGRARRADRRRHGRGLHHPRRAVHRPPARPAGHRRRRPRARRAAPRRRRPVDRRRADRRRRDGIDALVTTAMKWLLGPPGIGFLYLQPGAPAPRRRSSTSATWGSTRRSATGRRDTMPPVVADAPPLRARPAESARRVRGARRHRAPARGRHRADLRASVEELVSPLSRRARRARRRSPDAGRSCAARGGDRLPPRNDPRASSTLCRARGVDIGAIGAVRVDPHGFNDEDDIDRFLDMLRCVLAGVRRQRVTRAAVCHRSATR